MISIKYTRNLFLRSLCVVYLCSFVSLYIQIPGLYGNSGILPARSALENNKYKSWSAKVHHQPTLLWLAPFLGLDTQYALDVIALLGIFLSFTGFVSQKFCTLPLYAALWSLYFSIYQVGQVFVKSQWDDLLLEVGSLALLIAPLLPGRHGKRFSERLGLLMVRWLLFRLMWTSGVVKLISRCPKWWNLNALQHFFQVTVLPSPLSWYAHHLPGWFLRITTVTTILSETVLPFLYFSPIRSIRITAFAIQLFFQISIVLTGNYNFVNLLIVTLLLSLLDDKFFYGGRKYASGTWSTILSNAANFLVHGAVVGASVALFNLKLNQSSFEIESKIGFTKEQFDDFLQLGIYASIGICFAWITVIVFRDIWNVVTPNGKSFIFKIFDLLCAMIFCVIAMHLFITSTVPLMRLHPATNKTSPLELQQIYGQLNKLHVVNDHQLFAKFPEKDGRLEIILEGSNNIEGPWQEYNFLYKPGNVNHSLPFVAPHSPRVDWQMAFAAQSTYKEQPWLVSLVHRLLIGVREVETLLDRNRSPFRGAPPKYICANLYQYKYTSWSERNNPSWWRRVKLAEYMPPLSKDSSALLEYLRARNLLPAVASPSEAPVNPVWKQVLNIPRAFVSAFEPSLLQWSIFTAGFALILTVTGGK